MSHYIKIESLLLSKHINVFIEYHHQPPPIYNPTSTKIGMVNV